MQNTLNSQIAEALDRLTAELASVFGEAVSALTTDLSSVGGMAKFPKTKSAPAKPGKAPAKGKAAAAYAAPVRPRPAPGKRIRRSEADLADLGDKIIKLLHKNKGGLRSEQINKELSTSTKEIMRPLLKLLEEGKIRKQGERRATTYFAAH